LASPGKHILIIVENLPVPFDKRVWNEANALTRAGYKVSVISPVGKGAEKRHEEIDGISVYRHPLPPEGNGALGYLVEYSAALFWELLLTLRIFLTRGFDAIHACNPPDTIFLIGLLFKPFRKKFVFDHHDINPELFIAKFGRKGLLYRLIVLLERFTFRTADISIATNESYKEIAVTRGHMDPSRVFIVRSGPNLKRFRPVPPQERLKEEGLDEVRLKPPSRRALHLLSNLTDPRSVHGVVGERPLLQQVFAVFAIRKIIHRLKQACLHFRAVSVTNRLDQ